MVRESATEKQGFDQLGPEYLLDGCGRLTEMPQSQADDSLDLLGNLDTRSNDDKAFAEILRAALEIADKYGLNHEREADVLQRIADASRKAFLNRQLTKAGVTL